MMTDKDRYVQQEIQKIYSFWISFSMIGGALSFLLLSGLDYLVTPENLFKFLYYRIAAASLLLIVLFFNTKSPYKFSPNTLVILSAIIASTAVEFLIVNFKGHQSTYYAGMIITIIFILGFMPISFGISFIWFS